MKFSLGDTGATSINQGVGSIFKALAMAPYMERQAAQQAALRDAQTYQANMAGNKYGSEAENIGFTLNQRRTAMDDVPADEPAYMRGVRRLFQMTGDTNADRVAKAGTEFQTQGIRDQALANVGNVDMMNRYNVLAKPGETYQPFSAVGNTGYALNTATGSGGVLDATLSKLFGDKTNSEIRENNAQASNASASASKTNLEIDRIKAGGAGKPLTAAQLRENAAIQEAREAVGRMLQGDVDAVLSQNPQMMTAEQRDLWNLIQRSRKPLFGETNVMPVMPMPNPPQVEEPGAMAKIRDWLTNAIPSKSPVAAPAAPTMAGAEFTPSQEMLQVQADYRAGKLTREQAKQKLKTLGMAE